MARLHIDYAGAGSATSNARTVDDPREGLFKVRIARAGAWIPVRVWLEDGERDPDTWELLSDQIWRAEWAPRTDRTDTYSAPLWRLLNQLTPIDEDEFQWLMLLRTLPSLSQSPKL